MPIYHLYNSIRFRCPCGALQMFPRSPNGGRKAISTETYNDGTVCIVTRYTKEVHCPCGRVHTKDRRDFSGKY